MTWNATITNDISLVHQYRVSVLKTKGQLNLSKSIAMLLSLSYSDHLDRLTNKTTRRLPYSFCSPLMPELPPNKSDWPQMR